MLSAIDMIDRMLRPVSQAMTGEAARRLVEMRGDPELQAQMAELAELANDGRLTPEQRSDYQTVLAVGTVVSLLQAKARATLAATSSAA